MNSKVKVPTRRQFLTQAGVFGLAVTADAAGGRLAADFSGEAGSFEAGVASILRRVHAPRFPAREFNIASFGARGNGQADARPALLRAIGECAAQGGGRVLVPAGTWRVDGPIHLKTNVNLHLDAGATIRFNPDPELYLPVELTRWEGTELYNYSPFIYARLAANVAITGEGIIDGNAQDTFVTWESRQEEDKRRLRLMGADGVPVRDRVFGEGHWLRPNFIQFLGCSGILVEGITLLNSPFWCMHTTCCTNVTIRGVRVDSTHLNNDGFDPESSSDVLVEDCRFATGDDAIAVKSGRDQDGWRIGRPSENIVIRRCQLERTGGSISFGSEMSGGIRNVFVENCTSMDARFGVHIKGNLDRGGVVEKIHVRNFACERVREAFIKFTTEFGPSSFRGGEFPPDFRDVILEDLHCREARIALYVAGAPGSPVRDVLLRRITVDRAVTGAVMKHYERFSIEDMTVNGRPLAPA